MSRKIIKRFIDDFKNDYSKNLKYSAGEICEDGDITNQQQGAENTFSIGMPIYSLDGVEIGKISMGLFHGFNYLRKAGEIDIPVETWRVEGYKGPRQKIKTYYQINAERLHNSH